MAEVLSWATVTDISESSPVTAFSLICGKWVQSRVINSYPDPLTGQTILFVPETQIDELTELITDMSAVPHSGLHNPVTNTERYNLYGQICAKAAHLLSQPTVSDFFTRLIVKFVPKSRPQAEGEIKLMRMFFQNFSGDQVRYLARGFTVPGDHIGQETCGYRWPYGPVAIIAPFNFPLEIPSFQLMGALFMGNKVVIKPDPRGAVCLEQLVRMLIYCGMPATDVNLLQGGSLAMENLIRSDLFQCIQFTGSTQVAHYLSEISKGKVKFEDSGFNWKILSQDVANIDYIAYVCDQDAYAFSGQKCSAEKLLFVHRNWIEAGLIDRLKSLAERRKLADLTITPVLTWTNDRIQSHIDKLLAIPGAKLLFGGAALTNHSIPSVYGAYLPTAVFIPIAELPNFVSLWSVELFGPLQIITEWNDISEVLPIISSLKRYLTAGIVSNDPAFLQKVIGATVNGTTYAGIRARTSGAPQNHWFGAAGDPRGSGIGTRESIVQTWSCHREIIRDFGPIPGDWTLPPAS